MSENKKECPEGKHVTKSGKCYPDKRKHGIRVKEGVLDVEYPSSGYDVDVKRVVESMIEKDFKAVNLPEIGGEESVGYKVDAIYAPEIEKYGFAFGIGKGQKFMRMLEGGMFEYRHDEVVAILKKIMVHLGVFEPYIMYGRGMGVFVYNIFLK